MMRSIRLNERAHYGTSSARQRHYHARRQSSSENVDPVRYIQEIELANKPPHGGSISSV